MCARHTQVVATNLRVYSASLSLTILSLQEIIQPRAKILLFGMEMAHWDIQVYYLKTIILIFLSACACILRIITILLRLCLMLSQQPTFRY